jgi:hypothetical protein
MARLRGALRQFVIFTLVLGLPGCFKSSAALIDKAHAQYPFKTITLKTEDNELQTVKRDGDVYRLIEDGEERGAPVLIHALAENLYIVQESPEEGETTYLFAKRDGDKIVFQNDCRGVGADTLKRLKVETRDDSQALFFSCQISELDALIGLGQSPDIWSGGTKTLQIVSIE